MRKTEAIAEAALEKQEASPDLLSNRTRSSHVIEKALLDSRDALDALMKLRIGALELKPRKRIMDLIYLVEI